MQVPNRFAIRAYGILTDSHGRLLVSDERITGSMITKFPGGGLEFGEGLEDCLKREFMEEAGVRVEILDHFYTTGFFQVSAFNPSVQVISVYYTVSLEKDLVELGMKGIAREIHASTKPFDFKDGVDDVQSFRWIEKNEIQESLFTLPIDRHVGKLLSSKM